jgi:serine protease AprX
MTSGSDRVRVIVEIRLSQENRFSTADRLGAALTDTGFQVDPGFDPITFSAAPRRQRHFWKPGATTVVSRGTISREEVPLLRAKPDVLAVWSDPPISQLPLDLAGARQPCPIPPCDCSGGKVSGGSLHDVALYLGADRVWATGCRGAGVVIGLLDCGISALNRLTRPGEVPTVPNVIDGYPNDWGTTSRVSGLWRDHGNMTATDILGLGIAPEASLCDIRISDGLTGPESILLSNALAGLDWAIQSYHPKGTPQILSNSWGLHKPEDEPAYARDPNHPLTRKFVEAIDAGMLVLFSAGNCGATCPASYCRDNTGGGQDIWGANGHPRVMTVGAVNLSAPVIRNTDSGTEMVTMRWACRHRPAWAERRSPTSATPHRCTGACGSDAHGRDIWTPCRGTSK